MGRLAQLAVLGVAPSLASGALSSAGRALMWADEFEGAAISAADWNWETWAPRRVNNELQSYGAAAANSYVAEGNLVLRAIQTGTSSYSSARLQTRYKHALKYGFVEVRAMLPTMQGAWPAIWMLPEANTYGGWPNSGELDIMEYVSCDPNKVHATVHTGAYNWVKGTQKGSSKANPTPGQYHLYQLEWTAEAVRFGLDNVTIMTFPNDGAGIAATWPFDQPFHLILNIAVGGDWGGYCLNGRPPSFPDDGVQNVMKVDYVRFYANDAVGAPTPPPTTPPPPGACKGPYPDQFPQCEDRVAWLMANFATAPSAATYIARGVDGSRCSSQNYLATYESWCPPCVCDGAATVTPTTAQPTTAQPTTAQPTTARPTTAQPTTAQPTTAQPTTARPTTARPTTARPTTARPTTARPTSKAPTGKPTPLATAAPSNVPGACVGPYAEQYSQCEARISWMLVNWSTAPAAATYKAKGVDGSRCSIQNYLATNEAFYCPRCACACQGPYAPTYPQCESRISWMLVNWSTAPAAATYKAKGVDGSRCSIQNYLATNEALYCPLCTCN
jgi:beta-glucanase (GH16 family)